MAPFVCFLKFAFVSNFASQRSELTLCVDLGFSPSPSGAQRQDIFLLVLLRKLMRAHETIIKGLQRAQDLDSFHLHNFSA
jgi:hypothetical protein